MELHRDTTIVIDDGFYQAKVFTYITKRNILKRSRFTYGVIVIKHHRGIH